MSDSLLFRKITVGCNTISSQVEAAYRAWCCEDIDDFAATARQMCRDAEVLQKQCAELEAAAHRMQNTG